MPHKPAEQMPPIAADLAADRVMTLPEIAQLTGLSVITLRRMVKDRTGPTITKLSERRIGVRVRHAREWLDARTSNAAE
jgi:predicted DNA-binding transcriptional regulator AlpA